MTQDITPPRVQVNVTSTPLGPDRITATSNAATDHTGIFAYGAFHDGSVRCYLGGTSAFRIHYRFDSVSPGQDYTSYQKRCFATSEER